MDLDNYSIERMLEQTRQWDFQQIRSLTGHNLSTIPKQVFRYRFGQQGMLVQRFSTSRDANPIALCLQLQDVPKTLERFSDNQPTAPDPLVHQYPFHKPELAIRLWQVCSN